MLFILFENLFLSLGLSIFILLDVGISCGSRYFHYASYLFCSCQVSICCHWSMCVPTCNRIIKRMLPFHALYELPQCKGLHCKIRQDRRFTIIITSFSSFGSNFYLITCSCHNTLCLDRIKGTIV